MKIAWKLAAACYFRRPPVISRGRQLFRAAASYFRRPRVFLPPYFKNWKHIVQISHGNRRCIFFFAFISHKSRQFSFVWLMQGFWKYWNCKSHQSPKNVERIEKFESKRRNTMSRRHGSLRRYIFFLSKETSV